MAKIVKSKIDKNIFYLLILLLIFTQPLGCVNTDDVSAQPTITYPYSNFSISPQNLYLLPNTSQQMFGQGGSGYYTFNVAMGDQLGSINPSSGLFTAGDTSGVVIVTATDTAGASTSATVVILEPLEISPANSFVTTGAQIQMVASGGLPPYKYSIISKQNESIDEATGKLSAPSEVGVAVIKVEDAAGYFAYTNISYYKPLSIIPSFGLFPSDRVLDLTRVGGEGDLTYTFLQGQGLVTIDPVTNRITPNPNASGIVQLNIKDSLGYSTNIDLNFFNPRFAALGKRHGCSVNTDGRLFCWGGNDRGQIADTTYGPHIGDDPLEMGDELLAISQFPNVYDIATIGHATCILYGPTSGPNVGKRVLRCWGEKSGNYGNAGNKWSDFGNWNEQNYGFGTGSYTNLYLSLTDYPYTAFLPGAATPEAGLWNYGFNLGDTKTNHLELGNDLVFGGIYPSAGTASAYLTRLFSHPSMAVAPNNATDGINGAGDYRFHSLGWFTFDSTLEKGSISFGGVGTYSGGACYTDISNAVCRSFPGAFTSIGMGSSDYSGTYGGGSYLSTAGQVLSFSGASELLCFVVKITTGASFLNPAYSNYANASRIVCSGNSNSVNVHGLYEGSGYRNSLSGEGMNGSVDGYNSYFSNRTASHAQFANVFATRNGDAGERNALDVAASYSYGPGSSGNRTVCGLFDDQALSGGNIVQCWGTNANGLLGIGINDQLVAITKAPVTTDVAPPYTVSNQPIVVAGHSIPAGTLANVTFPGGTNPVALFTNNYGTICAKTQTAGEAFYHLFCWGVNTNGELGLGTTSSYSHSPVEISMIATYGVAGYLLTDVRASGGTFCALVDHLTLDDKLICWGSNAFGKMGQGVDPNTVPVMPPNEVSLGTSFSVKSFSVGVSHSCAVSAANKIKCWGGRYFGQLGAYTAPINGDEPVEIGQNLHEVPLTNSKTAKKVYAGYNHTCVVLDGNYSGQVICFGANGDRQLARGLSTKDVGAANLEIIDNNIILDHFTLGGSKVIKITGSYSTWALTDDGKLYAWGSNSGTVQVRSSTVNSRVLTFDNLLGIGTTTANSGTPSLVPISSLTVKDVSVSQGHGCLAVASGDVHCWGNNSVGNRQMGRMDILKYPNNKTLDGSAANSIYSKVNLGASFKTIGVATGALHSCALSDQGKVKCWGNNSRGQLGLNVSSSRPNPVPMYSNNEMGDNLQPVNLGKDQDGKDYFITAIIAGDYHNCALTSNGKIVCWGDNTYGQLGIGTTNSVGIADGQMGSALTFVNIPPGNTALTITAGGNSSCAVLSNNNIICWGDNTVAQLGTGSKTGQGNTLFNVGAGFSSVQFPE